MDAFYEIELVRRGLRLPVKDLQSVRFMLLSWGPPLLLFGIMLIAGMMRSGPEFVESSMWAIFIVLLHVHGSIYEWILSQARVFLDEIDGRLLVRIPILGGVSLELASFQGAEIVPPEWPRWFSTVLLYLSIAFLLATEIFHFFSRSPVSLESLLFAGLGLLSALRTHRQQDYFELVMWFGVYTDWRRHLWPQRKIRFRGPQTALEQLKQQVELDSGHSADTTIR